MGMKYHHTKFKVSSGGRASQVADQGFKIYPSKIAKKNALFGAIWVPGMSFGHLHGNRLG